MRTVLDDVFAGRADLRGYGLDDQGSLRRHVTVFVDGVTVRDRAGLSDVVGTDAEVEVLRFAPPPPRRSAAPVRTV